MSTDFTLPQKSLDMKRRLESFSQDRNDTNNNENNNSYTPSGLASTAFNMVPNTVNTASLFIPSTQSKNTALATRTDSGLNQYQPFDKTKASTPSTSFQPPPEIIMSSQPSFAGAHAEVPNSSQPPLGPASKPSTNTKAKPVVSKKPNHLSAKSKTDLSSSHTITNISKHPAPIPPNRSQKPHFQSTHSSNAQLVSPPVPPKSGLKLDTFKRNHVNSPTKKGFAPPPAIPPKSINISAIKSISHVVQPGLENNNNSSITKASTPLNACPPIPISTHPLRGNGHKHSLSHGTALSFIPPPDIQPQNGLANSPESTFQNTLPNDGNQSQTVPLDSLHISSFVPPSPIPPTNNQSVGIVKNDLQVYPLGGASFNNYSAIERKAPSFSKSNPIFVPPALISSNIPAGPIAAPVLSDPASFLPPPKHYTVTPISQNRDLYSSPKAVGGFTHRKGSSYAVASLPRAKTMPLCPPLPARHPNSSAPGFSNSQKFQEVETKSPGYYVVPPPSSRNPESPTLQSHSLNDSRWQSPTVGSSPVSAIPIPPTAVPSLPTASLQSIGPTDFDLKKRAAPIPTSAHITSPVTQPASASFLESLPDATLFPPPPRRGEIMATSSVGMPDPTDTTNSITSSSAHTIHDVFTPPPPPPVRNGTNEFILGNSQKIDESNVNLNNTENNSPEDGASDSDDEASNVHPVSPQDTVYPDFSQSNRREPIFGGPMHEVSSRKKVDAIAFYGSTLFVSSASNSMAIDVLTGEKFWNLSHPDTRTTALAFKPNKDPELCGRIVWMGTKEGHLWEVDIRASNVLQKRSNVHMSVITDIHVVGDSLWTISEDGKICIWDGFINDVPKVFRMTPHFKTLCIVGDYIWIGKNRQVSIYHPSLSEKDSFNVTSRPIPCLPVPPGRSLCGIICSAYIQKYPDYVFFGHEDGTVTVFSRSKCVAIESVNISLHKITSMSGVGSHLWIGSQSGTIYIADVGVQPWKIIKDWKAHETPVRAIVSNEKTFFSAPQLSQMPVVSVGLEQGMLIWDGLLKTDWIENDMNQHDSEFCTFGDVQVLYVTWNVGAAKPSDLDRTDYDRMFLSSTFNRACPDYKNGPEVIVFGFQELVDLDNKSLTAKTIFQSKKDKMEKNQKVATSTHISHQYKDWQDRLNREIASYFEDNYNLVHSSNMVGLFTCVFVKASESSRIRSIKSGKTKTGLGGLHGNKGGIVVRLMYGDSSICFVNCHLAAGQNNVSQRNKNIEVILETPFLEDSDNAKYIGKGIFSNGGNGAMILDHEFCFFAGDMNYRINLHRPTAIQMIQDKDFARLLEADQLITKLKKDPSHRLCIFQEAKIDFLPTYKFDVGTDTYDTSEKRRVPAWCDRVFYRGRDDRITVEDYGSLAVRVSDHKPVMALYKLKVKTINPGIRQGVYKEALSRWQRYLDMLITELAQYYKGYNV